MPAAQSLALHILEPYGRALPDGNFGCGLTGACPEGSLGCGLADTCPEGDFGCGLTGTANPSA